MADILIYGKLKNAGGGKLVDYGAVDGAPTLAQSSGDSTTAVMSQKATVETIKSELANMAPFRFFGTAYYVVTDGSGNASTIYAKRSDLIFSFDTSGDSVNIDGYGAAYSYDFSTDLYTISLNGAQVSDITFYYVPSSGTLLYYDESYIPVQTLGGKTVSQVLSSAVWESDNHLVYRLDDEQVKLLPKGGAVWQYSDKEYVGNGTNWVLLGFNVSVSLDNIYTKSQSDARYVRIQNIAQATGTSTTVVMSQKAVTDAIEAALGTAESALAEV